MKYIVGTTWIYSATTPGMISIAYPRVACSIIAARITEDINEKNKHEGKELH